MRSSSIMIPAVRQEKILQILSENDIVTIDTLMEKLYISLSTLRRDLTKLNNEGKILLFHGGGVRLAKPNTELTMDTKLHLHDEAKKRISQKAATYISEGDVIFIDPSSTTYHMIDHLPKNITVVTNSIFYINQLIQKEIPCVMIGGTIKKSTNSCIGPIAEQILGELNFNKCFLGASGCSSVNGITNHDINEKTIKAIALQNSESSFFLMDSTKFDITTMVKVCALEDHAIITEHIPESYKQYSNIIEAEKN